MALTRNPPPQTPTEPVTEILHGIPITDSYRWLEDQNSARTRKWLEKQGAYTRTYLDAFPTRERIRKRIEELLTVDMTDDIWHMGDRYFFLKRTGRQEHPVIMMRDGKTREETTLVDPTERGQGEPQAVALLSISRDAKFVAYSSRCTGADFACVGIIDVDNKRILPETLPLGFNRGFVFSSTLRGFYYSHDIVGKFRRPKRAVYWHRFGNDTAEDTVIFAVDDDKIVLRLFGSGSSDYLAYTVTRTGTDGSVVDLYVHHPATGSPPRLLLQKMKGILSPLLTETQLILLTDWDAPNYRLLGMDIGGIEPNKWRELVPESNRRIQQFIVTGGMIFALYVENLSPQIEVFDLMGQKLYRVPCPSHSTVRLSPGSSNDGKLLYRFTSFCCPPETICYDTKTHCHETFAANRVPFNSSSIEVEQVWYPSKDGTLIPMFLMCTKGRRRSGSLPTILTGYGGFGSTITPQFSAFATVLAEQGCLYAIANVRGGAEFGAKWHLAAQRRHRQTAIDDFVAAAQWLLSEKHCAPDSLAAAGGSNAGLLVAAALTQRPDLFRAVLCVGPLLDMLRYHKFDFADRGIDEYGSPDNPEDFSCLLDYSPYHKVADGTAYPSVLLISGDADTRCNPLHARKMAARLQAATISQHPVLLDYKHSWGHVPVQPLSQRIEALTDRLGFICNELG